MSARPRLVDALVVAAGLIPAVITAFTLAGSPAPWLWIGLVLIPIQALPLWWRRSHPIVTLAVVTAAVMLQNVLLPRPAAGASILLGVYAVAVNARPRERQLVASIAGVVLFAGVLGILVAYNRSLSAGALGLGGGSLITWLIGDFIRGRRRTAFEMEAQRHRAQLEAAESERKRIARELHDVVAHNVSVMALTAGAARVAGGDKDQALAKVETMARATIVELNRLLGALRSGGEAPLEPQPSLARLDKLIQALQDAGIEVHTSVSGLVDALPASADLTGYRVLQEAVTNILKHACASRVEVSIACSSDQLALTVHDNGKGEVMGANGSGGHGLLGMRERLAMFDGELRTESSDLGGFTVQAMLRF